MSAAPARERISENFSEKATRGRPRATPPWYDHFAKIAPPVGVYSRRSICNDYYFQRALQTLVIPDTDGEFVWLFDREADAARRPRAVRKTVLVELGRIEDEALMRFVAVRLCDLKPKTQQAVALVRRVRLGGSPEPDYLQLANEVIHLVNRYRARRPETTEGQIKAALATAYAQVEGVDGEEVDR